MKIIVRVEAGKCFKARCVKPKFYRPLLSLTRLTNFNKYCTIKIMCLFLVSFITFLDWANELQQIIQSGISRTLDYKNDFKYAQTSKQNCFSNIWGYPTVKNRGHISKYNFFKNMPYITGVGSRVGWVSNLRLGVCTCASLIIKIV